MLAQAQATVSAVQPALVLVVAEAKALGYLGGGELAAPGGRWTWRPVRGRRVEARRRGRVVAAAAAAAAVVLAVVAGFVRLLRMIGEVVSF